MIGRRAAVGLSLLCALMFSALVVQSAAAQVGKKAENTTAFTCVKGGGNLDFKDAHCDEFVGLEKGEYGHVEIKNDETTELEITNDKTKDEITKEKLVPTDTFTPAVLKGTLGGVKAEVECKKVASVAKKSFIHNVLVEKKHTVTGTVQVNFTECEVKKPTKCKIKEPIVTTATFEGVEGLKSPGGGKEEMGVEFKGEGENGTFAELFFEPKECSLFNEGKAFLVKGTATATGKTATQKEKHSGATSVYIPNKEGATKEQEAEEMQTLEIGLKPAFFSGTFTTTMAGVGGNPITLTTLT